MKIKVVLLGLAFFATLLFATQRVMVMEDFTATWCTYCPGAARGAEELKFRAFDSVVVIAYHSSSSDPFYTPTAASRMSYYGVTGYPTMRLDGGASVVGGMHNGTMYPTYRQFFDGRKVEASPFDISLSVTYDSVTRNGVLTIVVRNTSTSAISGQLHTVLTESHIYYPWQGMDSLYDVERLMLPNASGEAITVNPGDSLVRTRNFTIQSSWVAKNCEFVVFVQNNTTKWMYQGASVGVIPEPELEFVGYQPVFPAPGDSFNLTVGLRNLGSAATSGASAVLSTDDPYLTILNSTTSFGAIGRGEDGYGSNPFKLQVSSTCPEPHLATMRMVVTSNDMAIDTVTFPLNITTSAGFADNMEQGEGGWTHGGIRDYWHRSNYRSSSPSYSWYCGVEGSHQYTNENDARLVTPFFTLGDSSWLRFKHYYETEADYDFCIVELNNGSPFWWQLGIWSGSSNGWRQEELDLSSFQNQTVRLRFRFISDYNVVGEGWYIDDFECGTTVGVTEQKGVMLPAAVVVQSPVRNRAEVRFLLPLGAEGQAAVYDATGTLVRMLGENLAGSGSVIWNLTDRAGKRVSSGSYFIRLSYGNERLTIPLVVTR
ncbi:MAG: Omp28-related outer membrane protein [bacterium]